MSSFELAIPTVLRHEGGLVNNPNDPGGITDYGVSLRWLKTLGHDGDFDHDGVVGPHDILAMSKDDAIRLYDHYWWERYQYGLINDQTIATKVFDTSVNMGATWGHKILQRALDINDDGVLGPQTLQRTNAANAGLLLPAYQSEQWKHYQAIAAANPKLVEFLKGWRNRAFDRV